jgi:hypothetical protein
MLAITVYNVLFGILLEGYHAVVRLERLQLMLPAETARDTIAALGEVGQLQFKDLSEDKSPLQRTFANQVTHHQKASGQFRGGGGSYQRGDHVEKS